MATIFQSKPVKIARLIFRWMRILFLFAVFIVVVGLAYFHLVGLPDIVKQPLLQKLREHGVEMQFTSMKLGWENVLVENASFRSATNALGPKVTAARTELLLDFSALTKAKLTPKALLVEHGQLLMPLAQSNRVASLDAIEVKINFLPNDQLQLENLQANFRGTKIHLSAALTNATAMRDWKLLHATPTTNKNFQAKLEKFMDGWDKIHFASPPELNLAVNGDARDLDSLKAVLTVTAAKTESPWASANNFKLTVQAMKLWNSSGKNFLKAHVVADEISSRWGDGKKIDLTAALARNAENTNLFQSDIAVVAAALNANWTNALQTNWLRGADFRGDGKLSFFATNFIPQSASVNLKTAQAESRWGAAEEIKIVLEAKAAETNETADASWAAWAKVAPFALHWQVDLRNLSSPKIEAQSLSCAGQWRTPDLKIEKLQAQLYDGHLDASAQLNVVTREARAQIVSDFEPRKIAPLLTPAGQHWISQYTWNEPPKVRGFLSAILPAWNNRQPDWRAEVLPTLQITGNFTVPKGGAFRGVPASSAESEFTYAKRTWHLPRIHAVRPDGEVFLEYRGNDETHEYFFSADTKLDVKIARPLIEQEKAREVLDQLQFTEAPKIHAEVWGRWHERERIGFTAQVEATNFTFRGERVDSLSASVNYTNLVMQARDIRVIHAGKEITAPFAEGDFAAKKIFLTNVVSDADPMAVCRAISPKFVEAVAPYRFAQPPHVRMNGSFLIREPKGTDLHFDVVGENFRWTNVVADKVSGHMDWIGNSLRLTNVQAKLYGKGQAMGWAEFNFTPRQRELGVDCQFNVSAIDLSLPLIARSVSEKTNRLEGSLDAQLTITSGNTRDKKSWQGYGRAHLHDALLWEIPIFGIFSPVLNVLMPGAGNSVARAATANFMITNSLVYSDDLEIRASGFRLQYHGGVDASTTQVDARVEAEILRDAWVIGRVLSLALTPLSKLFEYHITGTLKEPKMAPTFIPKFLMLTLRPFHTLKGLATPGQEPAPVLPSDKEQKIIKGTKPPK